MKRYFTLTSIFLVLLAGITHAQEQIPDEVMVTYSANQKALKQILLELTDKSGINIAFQDEILPVDSLITYTARNRQLGLVIDDLIFKTGNKYKIVGNQIVIINDEFSKGKDLITISGYITDKESSETLISANIFLYDKSDGTTSNEYGFYSLTIPKGVQRLYFSYLGYKMDIREIKLKSDTTINVSLNPSVQLNEVLILENENIKAEESPASISTLPVDKINSFVSIVGESDVLRLVHSQAGVTTGTDGFGGMSVRGGSVDQNLILLDGVPIYNPNHALGIFSVFNSSVIKSATLYKSGFPARYGSRLSSVLDIWIKDGNKEKFGADVGVSLIALKGTIEGPIVKGKSSFLVSFRRTLLDQWIKLLSTSLNTSNGREGQLNYFFYDLNAKLNFKLGKKSSIYFSYYQGKDDYSNNSTLMPPQSESTFTDIDKELWNWGNQMGVVRYSHQLSKKAFLKSSVYYTKYNFETFDASITQEFQDSSLISTEFLAGLYKSNIADTGFNLDFDYLPNSRNTLKFGSNIIFHTFSPGVLVTNHLNSEIQDEDISIEDLEENLQAPTLKGTEIQFYIEDQIKTKKNSTFNIGFHQSIIRSGNKTFFLPQPRLAYMYNKKGFTFKTSISFVSQYLHMMTNAGLGIPVDVWLPSTEVLTPQKGWIASSGFNINTEKGYEIGAEVFYKRMSDLLSFGEGEILNIGTGLEWQERIPVGQGLAYGLETHLNKNLGNVNWNLNYTLSWAERQFDAINNGEPFAYRYDRRHNLKLSYIHKINTHTEFTLAWHYSSGNPITLPTGVKEVQIDNGEPIEILVYAQKNNRVLPDYHRLDLGFNFYSSYKFVRQKLSLGIINIYNKLNPFYIDVVKTDSNPAVYEYYKYSLLPVLPNLSISWSF